MSVKVKKLDPKAVVPQRMTDGAAGYDLSAVSCEFDCISGRVVYGTGLAFQIPRGYVGLLFPRSSVRNTGYAMANSVGVIDSDYRGEVSATFVPVVSDPDLLRPYSIGDRVAQMVIVPVLMLDDFLEEVDELTDTKRGEGGHGSTGR